MQSEPMPSLCVRYTVFQLFNGLSYLIYSEPQRHRRRVHLYPLGKDLPHPSRIWHRHPNRGCWFHTSHDRSRVHERSVRSQEGGHDSHSHRRWGVRTYCGSVCQVQRRHRDRNDVDEFKGGACEGTWCGSRYSVHQGGYGAKSFGDHERCRCGGGV